MSDLRELYQQLILDHGRRPKNFRSIAGADAVADGYNPLCGDKIRVFVALSGETIKDLSFQGEGCAISTASASLMSETVKGKTRQEAQELFTRFHQLVTDEHAPASAELGKLEVFAGVREFPIRVKCATLPWHTLVSALQGSPHIVTTETS